VYSGASGVQNVDKLFFVLGWDRHGFDKKRARTHCVKLVFLHLVGATGRIVHSNVQNVDPLFFILNWDRYGLHKKHAGTHHVVTPTFYK
jgi:hypothetical protein